MKRRVNYLGLLALAVAAPALPAQEAGQKLAIVIGVSDYTDEGIRDLRFCDADAEAVQAELVKPEVGGFRDVDVVLLHSGQTGKFNAPTRENILSEVGRALARAGKADTILVFFSGHGATDGQGRGYLIPQDCRRNDIPGTAVPVAELVRMFGGSKARNKMLILDCCHAGAAGKNLVVQGAEGVTQPGAEALARPFANLKNVITLASCKTDELSYEWGEKSQGYFTYFLTEGLRTGFADLDANGTIRTTELYDYIKDRVSAQVKKDDEKHSQTPVQVVPVQGAVPDFPIASALGVYREDFKAVQDGTLPAGWEGSARVLNGKMIPTARESWSTAGLPVGVTRPRMQGDFTLECAFDMGPSAREAISLKLIPVGGRPLNVEVWTLASRKGVVLNGNFFKAKGKFILLTGNTLTLKRSGGVLSVAVNGETYAAPEVGRVAVEGVQIGLFRQKQQKPVELAVTSVSLKKD